MYLEAFRFHGSVFFSQAGGGGGGGGGGGFAC